MNEAFSVPTWAIAAMAADVVSFGVARWQHSRDVDEERAFDLVAWIAAIAAGLVAGGYALSRFVGVALWLAYVGAGLSWFIAALMVWKNHRPLLRAVTGGRLGRPRRWSRLGALEARHGATLAGALRGLVVGEWRAHDGKIVAELPNYTSDPDTGLAARFGDLALLEQANDWSIDWQRLGGWVPLAALESEDGETESQFLVVRAAAPHAVGMWEHETGEIEDVAPSLEAFLAALRPARGSMRADR